MFFFFSGWGPHLRGIMRDDSDNLYFGTNIITDSSQSVLINRKSKGDSTMWSEVKRFAHAAGQINQKDAFVFNGQHILAYAVNFGAARLEECYYTVVGGLAACNHILIGTSAYVVEASSNYVGAAITPGGHRVVWWTTVGAQGNAGQFKVIANYGGGWNGPFGATILPFGWVDLAYVHMTFEADLKAVFIAQSIVGDYSNCNNVCFRAGVGKQTFFHFIYLFKKSHF
jgi:hypothetical protein